MGSECRLHHHVPGRARTKLHGIKYTLPSLYLHLCILYRLIAYAEPSR
jgi:hypothetical protein